MPGMAALEGRDLLRFMRPRDLAFFLGGMVLGWYFFPPFITPRAASAQIAAQDKKLAAQDSTIASLQLTDAVLARRVQMVEAEHDSVTVFIRALVVLRCASATAAERRLFLSVTQKRCEDYTP